MDYEKLEKYRTLDKDLKRAANWSNLPENREYAFDNIPKFIQKYMDPLDVAYRALSKEEKKLIT